ncbi:CCHC-type domain-containing protein [Abeliophyllum distichum]|uniref:CCHC-type domain-containing protein n=1 Tax=Abeliophyllum distichum TaxID=126358 RepID=A0ABD1SZF9_9LAMI
MILCDNGEVETDDEFDSDMMPELEDDGVEYSIESEALFARQSKLHPREDEQFQSFQRINDNAYKLDLPGEYNVSATFNVADLSSFDAGNNSRLNHFEEGGDDANHILAS